MVWCENGNHYFSLEGGRLGLDGHGTVRSSVRAWYCRHRVSRRMNEKKERVMKGFTVLCCAVFVYLFFCVR